MFVTWYSRYVTSTIFTPVKSTGLSSINSVVFFLIISIISVDYHYNNNNNNVKFLDIYQQ